MARPAFTRIAVLTLKTAIILINPSMHDRFDAVQEWASQILPPDPENEVPIRDLQRQIESAIDKAADYLESIRTIEYRSVSDQDIQAGLSELSKVLSGSFESLNADEILANVITPSDVSARLQATLEAQWASQSARRFLRKVLDASCYQLVNWVREVPAVRNRIAWQTLINTWNLTTATSEILKELQQTGLVGARDAGRVLNSQRRDVAAILGKMDLFGVPAESRFRRVPFTTSYVTIHGMTDQPQAVPVPFDELITTLLDKQDNRSQGLRLLVSGRAGSGKTTVAQWLAYQSATGGLEDRHQKLARTIPFFVRLREALKGEFTIPSDDSLLMSGQLRDGFNFDLLESLGNYRPLLVLDGWDEVNAVKQPLAAAWLASLCDRFPNAHIIVTTRPEGSSDSIFSEQHFTRTRMALLAEEKKLEIVERWFLGIKGNLFQSPDLDETYLTNARAQLLKDIRTPNLSKLAETPLLVAMLCCLYAKSTRRNPVSKSVLYETVIAVLIHERDRDREVKSGIWDDLHFGQKEKFLGNIALKMSQAATLTLPLDTRDNYATSIQDIAREILPSFGRSQLAAETLCAAAFERSGVLQRVEDDKGEFAHRTFQDYFAGVILARNRDMQTLFDLAQNEVYLGILPFAIRTADPELSNKIMEWLVFRIDNCTSDNEYRTLAFAAVECLNAAVSLEPRTRAEAVRTVEPLFPPENSDDAAALAAVGDAAVDFLRVGIPSTLERYCIEALSRIGTPRAIGALREYALSRGRAVADLLFAAWDRLPEKDYAEAVLSVLASEVSVKIHSSGQLRIIPRIGSISSIMVDGIDLSQDAIAGLAALRSLRDLTINECRGLKDCGSLEHLNSVDTLQLSNMQDLAFIKTPPSHRIRILSLRDLKVKKIIWEEAIGALADLRVLWIERVEQIKGSSAITIDIPSAVLANFARLKTLVLNMGRGRADLAFLDKMPSLSKFYHSGWIDEDGMRRIGKLGELRSAHLSFASGDVIDTDVSPLGSLAMLRDITLNGAGLGSACKLHEVNKITKLRCMNARILAVDSAVFPDSLHHLEFYACYGLGPGLVNRRTFRHVKSLVWRGPGLKDVNFLQSFPALEYLDLADVNDLENVDGVSYLPDGCRARIIGGKSSANTLAIINAQMRCAIRYEPRESWESRVSVSDDINGDGPSMQEVS